MAKQLSFKEEMRNRIKEHDARMNSLSPEERQKFAASQRRFQSKTKSASDIPVK